MTISPQPWLVLANSTAISPIGSKTWMPRKPRRYAAVDAVQRRSQQPFWQHHERLVWQRQHPAHYPGITYHRGDFAQHPRFVQILRSNRDAICTRIL